MTKARKPRPIWSYTFNVFGPGAKQTDYGLLWMGRDDRAARAHVKAWANGYHGTPNRVTLIACYDMGRAKKGALASEQRPARKKVREK